MIAAYQGGGSPGHTNLTGALVQSALSRLSPPDRESKPPAHSGAKPSPVSLKTRKDDHE